MIINLAIGLGFGGPGMEARIAWEAHIGGFLAGFFGVSLFDRGSRPSTGETLLIAGT
jgi:membrane associated rhomboid family serine protease